MEELKLYGGAIFFSTLSLFIYLEAATTRKSKVFLLRIFQEM